MNPKVGNKYIEFWTSKKGILIGTVLIAFATTMGTVAYKWYERGEDKRKSKLKTFETKKKRKSTENLKLELMSDNSDAYELFSDHIPSARS